MNKDARILVVDDEPLIRDIVSEWLTTAGYRVQTASDGVEALALLEREPADVVVSDIRMPRMDGIALLANLKGSAANIPAVLFVSGFADISPREAYDLGAEAVIQKPFSDDQLLLAVRHVLTPPEELWRAAPPAKGGPMLHSDFSTVAMARESRRLSFGRGGFCVQTDAVLREGPVGFNLCFSGENTRIAGYGTVRWVAPSEREVGVEIAGLSDDSMAQGLHLIAHRKTRSYIPRSAS